MTPNERAEQAIALYDARHADRIVAERNNGGDTVESTLDAGAAAGPKPTLRLDHPMWAAHEV